MMRPMKMAGDQLIFGNGCLEFLKTLPYKKAFIVTGGSSMQKSGILAKVEGYLQEAGAQTAIFTGVEPDPSFNTVKKGVAQMLEFQPDLIVALGGGSSMDAAKTMWVYYEHPELKTLEEVLTANPFPKLRGKARFACIPSTAGTASEVSRSVVISDGGLKHGLGNMEMMPDIAICDPQVTVSMPARITAETGMDAMTHALEALGSQRANDLSDTLAEKAAIEIFSALPIAYNDGNDLVARERMLNASMLAGIAFTNVSLGIVHSIAHTVGGKFHVAHGLADAIILPYIIRFNLMHSSRAKEIYARLAQKLGKSDLAVEIETLNKQLSIPTTLGEMISQEGAYEESIPEMAKLALVDGCTKTNPVIPDEAQMCRLLRLVYTGI